MKSLKLIRKMKRRKKMLLEQTAAYQYNFLISLSIHLLGLKQTVSLLRCLKFLKKLLINQFLNSIPHKNIKTKINQKKAPMNLTYLNRPHNSCSHWSKYSASQNYLARLVTSLLIWPQSNLTNTELFSWRIKI